VTYPNIYTLSLHDALPIFKKERWKYIEIRPSSSDLVNELGAEKSNSFFRHVVDLRPDLEALFRGLNKNSIQRAIRRAEREVLSRSEEHTSELQSRENLVCR